MIPEDISDWGEFLKELGCRNIIVYEDWAMCECVFHTQTDTTRPSLGINKDSGACHCFSCGYKSWEEFCDVMGISSDSYVDKISHKQWDIFRNKLLNKETYQEYLRFKPPTEYFTFTYSRGCIRYFDERDISRLFARSYNIGYFHSHSKYPKYDDSLLFPIYDEKGILYFQSRYVGNDESRNRWSQPKGCAKWKTYWAWKYAQGYNYVIFNEGITDSLKLRQFGLNAIPAKDFSIIQMRLIIRAPWECIFLLYDNDEGGEKYFHKASVLFDGCGKQIISLKLPDNVKDPAMLSSISSLVDNNSILQHDSLYKIFH